MLYLLTQQIQLIIIFHLVIMSELISSLIRCSTQIIPFQIELSQNRQGYCDLFLALLYQFQPQYFSQLNEHQYNSLIQINFLVRNYYEKAMNIDLGKQFIIHKEIDDKSILNMFKLVFGIGLKSDHQKLICCVMKLNEIDQKNLIPFFEQVRNFVMSQNQNYQSLKRQKNMIQQLQNKQNQIKELREKNEQLCNQLKQLQNNFKILKEDKERILEQLNGIRKEKYQLVSELGLINVNPSYNQILQRYKEKQTLYYLKLEQLQRQCEIKNIEIEQKNTQVEMLNKTYSNLNISIKNNQEQIIEKYKKQVQSLNDTIKRITNEYNQKIKQFKENIQKNRQQLLEENKKLKNIMIKLENTQQKYKQLKKIYKSFYKNIKPQIQI